MGSIRSGSGGVTDGSGDINIVELNLYGIASLFEKPGTPPVAAEDGADPATPPGANPMPKSAPKVEARDP